VLAVTKREPEAPPDQSLSNAFPGDPPSAAVALDGTGAGDRSRRILCLLLLFCFAFDCSLPHDGPTTDHPMIDHCPLQQLGFVPCPL